MSWTSHAYHIAKDFQVLGAASLTFAAAGLAFWAQNIVANKNTKSALTLLERQQRKARHDEESERLRYRLAFSVAMADTVSLLTVDLHRLHGALGGIASDMKVDPGTQKYTIDANGPLWTFFLSQAPLRDGHDIFSTKIETLARLSPEIQTEFRTIILLVNGVDHYRQSIVSQFDKSNSISAAQIKNIMGMIDNAMEELEGIQKKSRDDTFQMVDALNLLK